MSLGTSDKVNKESLKCNVKKKNIKDEALVKLLCEVEAILNGRPLTKVADDPRDFNALTPNHLLLFKSNESFPPGIFSKNDEYCRRRWRQIQYLAGLFWKRWIKEYLPILQYRNKWQKVKRNIAEGDIVLVVEQNIPRGEWPVGRFSKVNAGRDGLVRSAEVRTGRSNLLRLVHKLCLLEACES